MKTTLSIPTTVYKVLSFKIMIILIIIFPSSGVYAQSTTKTENPEQITWKSYWKNGYQLESSDKNFKLKFGGRIMHDWVIINQDDSLEAVEGTATGGTEFRRVRFFNSGTLYHSIKYKLQLDFAGGNMSYKDVYIQFPHLPVVGNFIMGHFKEPFGLEELTSSKYISFMERSLTSPFVPSRNVGMMLFNHALDKKMTWAIGIFRDAGNDANVKTSNVDRYNITGRITALPLYNKDKSQILHIGLAYSKRNPDDDLSDYPEVQTYKLSARAETHLGNKYASANLKDVSNVDNIGTEVAFVTGPLSMQGEYIHSSVKRTIQEAIAGKVINVTNNFFGFYTMASIFLTKGDHRSYKTSAGVFSRVKPKNNFNVKEGGFGALELAIRYSGLNLVDGKSDDGSLIAGGNLKDITLGLNWYLNPASRVMFNYIFDNVKNADIGGDTDKIEKIGKAGIFQMRFQIDF